MGMMTALACVALSTCALSGCSADAGGPDATADGELGSTSEALGGTWATPPTNYGTVTGDSSPSRGGLQVCRVAYDNGWQSGKVWHDNAGHLMCEYGWGGVSHYAVWTNAAQPAPYQVLVSRAGQSWVNPNPYGYQVVQLPSNTIEAGAAGSKQPGQTNYICEAKGADGNWHPGKFFNQYCLYSYGGSPNNSYGKEIQAFPGTYGLVKVLVQN